MAGKKARANKKEEFHAEVEYPAESELWRFMRTHFDMDAFVVFDSAQAYLLALDDFERGQETKVEEKQPTLQMPPTSGKDAAAGETAGGFEA